MCAVCWWWWTTGVVEMGVVWWALRNKTVRRRLVKAQFATTVPYQLSLVCVRRRVKYLRPRSVARGFSRVMAIGRLADASEGDTRTHTVWRGRGKKK